MGEPRKFFLFRWIDRLSEASGYLSGIAMLIAMLILCQAIAFRYFLGASATWQIELSIYLLIFTAFVGGAYGLKHDSHVGVDLLTTQLPERGRAAMGLIASLLALVLIMVVGWRAFGMWWEATELGWRSETKWGPPLAYPYFILPLGMTLIALQYVVIISDSIQRLAGKGGPESDTSEEKAEKVAGLE